MAGIQNSGVFQHGLSRHLFLVCTAKILEQGEGLWWEGGQGGKRKRVQGGGIEFTGVVFSYGRYLIVLKVVGEGG